MLLLQGNSKIIINTQILTVDSMLNPVEIAPGQGSLNNMTFQEVIPIVSH